jgi:succinate dehydrogenase/fumarate reductase flavoprotein subunit
LQDFPVTVIGGGPSGLSCVLGLRKLGFKEVVLVEKFSLKDSTYFEKKAYYYEEKKVGRKRNCYKKQMGKYVHGTVSWLNPMCMRKPFFCLGPSRSHTNNSVKSSCVT